jgi:hypothetical protein
MKSSHSAAMARSFSPNHCIKTEKDYNSCREYLKGSAICVTYYRKA